MNIDLRSNMDINLPKRTVRTGPEQAGLRRLRKLMESRGWFIKKVHGGKYQFGFPDLYCLHKEFGHRWIEMKAPGEKLRDSQIKVFADFETYGDNVYVLEDEKGYGILFKLGGNWKNYA